MRHHTLAAASGFCFTVMAATYLRAADAPSVELALKFRPVHGSVDYETPTADEFKDCKVEVERIGKMSGWVVKGAAGQPLRRFFDTNGDNVVDRWSYYNHGLEVYRDIDSNFNNKVDQSRWLNSGGSRWAVDENEDGRIDSWKILSAAEAARIAFEALISGDEKLFATLLVTDDDIKSLGIAAPYAGKLQESVESAPKALRGVVTASKGLSSQTKWMRFDSQSPGVIPADDGKADEDLFVYENAMAIVESRGEPLLIQIGEIVRVGEVWKLTQVPRPLEGSSVQVTDSGVLMQPGIVSANPAAGTTGLSPEMQKLLEQLQELDSKSPPATASASALAAYNTRRADLLAELVNQSSSDEEREQWTRQMVDGLASAVQSGAYADGLKRLSQIESNLRSSKADSNLIAYVSYRHMLSDYSLSIQKADNSTRQNVQKEWLDKLEKFVETWPNAEDTPEALLQLAISNEFSGDLKVARTWYEKLADRHAQTPAGQRATGAIRRLDLPGKRFAFSGKGLDGRPIDAADYRGKALLVFFWATWCRPCTEDLPQILSLYEEYRSRGFEIIGVNLDVETSGIRPYLTQHRVPWPQIFEDGGLNSPPARQFGIISLPTMFLVDQRGEVISRNSSVEELKQALPELLKK